MFGLPSSVGSYLRHPSHILKNVLWRFPKTTSSQPHVFILGPPRSGTTLLHVIIGAHSNFYENQGETGLFTWQDVFDPARNHFQLGKTALERFYRESSDLVDFFDTVTAYVLASQEADRFVEKTPQHVLRLDFITSNFPNAHVVHLFRDGRDTFCSARAAGIPRSNSLKGFARYWARCVQSRLDVGSRSGIIDVSYETLTSRPELTVRRIMNFLGEPYEDDQLSQNIRASDCRSNVEKFARLGEEISTSSQGRWRSELSPGEIAMFESLAGDELRSLGYEPSDANSVTPSPVLNLG